MSRLAVYFYCGAETPFQADIHALAESLKHFGADIYANKNWWLSGPDAKEPLFQHHPSFNPRSADIVICSKASYRNIDEKFQPVIHPFPRWLTNKQRKFFLVFLEEEDAYEPLSWYPPFTDFDLVLRTKSNQRAFRPNNFRPWQIGISDYVLRRGLKKSRARQKKIQILENYNASHPFLHPLRDFAKKQITPLFEKKIHIEKKIIKWDNEPDEPYDRFHQKQVGRYYNSHYHDLLAESAGCFSFCGQLIPGCPHNPSTYLAGGNRAKIQRMAWELISRLIGIQKRAIQWDSFRFWESLAFACCPIHVDLERFGVQLPVMPKNWEHYIGLNPENLKDEVARIIKDPQIMIRIGQQGQTWLQENYGIVNLAKLFLAYVQEMQSDPFLDTKLRAIQG